MFGLKSILGKTSSGSVKAMASNNFLDAMNNINQVKESSVKERNDKRLEQANEFFYEAKSKLDQCISSNTFPPTRLKEISILFTKSIELNHNNQEAYMYLSKIFYILGNDKLSIKYLKIAKTIYNNSDTDKLSEVLSNEHIGSDKNINNKIPSTISNLQKLQAGNFPTSKPVAKTSVFSNFLKK